ncbi:response regulator [Plantibacter sp. Mn2098]|uniref:response regulator n=1 Tax=Plantibacter sp. Mn2098 TaxID=3395266 RepID=UPI003BEC976B
MPVRIAVVDDDAGFRRVAGLVLAARGYEVVGEAADIASGYTLIATTHPDTALIDYHLPDGNGSELCALVRTLAYVPRMLIVSSDASVVTATGDDTPIIAKERLASIDVNAYL